MFLHKTSTLQKQVLKCLKNSIMVLINKSFEVKCLLFVVCKFMSSRAMGNSNSGLNKVCKQQNDNPVTAQFIQTGMHSGKPLPLFI